MMDYTVFKAKILTKSSIEIANASLFEILLILFSIAGGSLQTYLICGTCSIELLITQLLRENLPISACKNH